jgi:hypothetical protein
MDRREQQTELLPLLEGASTFDVVLRGYDRHQVHEHVERLEADLRIAVAERDTVAARLTELAGSWRRPTTRSTRCTPGSARSPGPSRRSRT